MAFENGLYLPYITAFTITNTVHQCRASWFYGCWFFFFFLDDHGHLIICAEQKKIVFFWETCTALHLTFGIYRDLCPPIFVTFGNGRLWKDAQLLVPPTYWARAQKVKTAIGCGGMGGSPASPKGIGQN